MTINWFQWIPLFVSGVIGIGFVLLAHAIAA